MAPTFFAFCTNREGEYFTFFLLVRWEWGKTLVEPNLQQVMALETQRSPLFKTSSYSPPSPPQIWDLENDTCLFTASSKASGIKGELAACLYLPGPRALCVAAIAVALLHLRLRYQASLLAPSSRLSGGNMETWAAAWNLLLNNPKPHAPRP